MNVPRHGVNNVMDVGSTDIVCKAPRRFRRRVVRGSILIDRAHPTHHIKKFGPTTQPNPHPINNEVSGTITITRSRDN